MEVSCKELRDRAWDRLGGNYWKSMGVSALGSVIANAGYIFTTGAISYGVAGYYVDQQRGKDAEFSQMFDGFGNYGRTFVGCLLQVVFLCLWSLIPIVGWVIGGLIKPFSYSMTYYVMRDFGLDGGDAITKSRELMDGYKWKLFKLRLSFIGWILLAILSFGVGMFFLMPYMEATMAEFYAELLKCNNIALGSEAVDAE